MAWLTDPRKWDDDWWSGLSPNAARVWEACLTGPFRSVLPGLCRGVSASILYETCVLRVRRPERRGSPEEFATDLEELLQPDEHGKVHFYFDRSARVARIPMAPAYNHADNPNVLTAWYRAWRDVPDCDLKFQHIESLRLGVNFAFVDKHQRRTMSDKWEATFGQPERAYLDGGKKLKTYVDLRERWVHGKAAQEPDSNPQTSLSFSADPEAPAKTSGHLNGSRPAPPSPNAEPEGETLQRPRLPPGLE
jgi:hypothetical protein